MLHTKRIVVNLTAFGFGGGRMNRISHLRASKNVSQVTLAEALGWSQGRLSNYESGRRIPSLADSRAITAALNDLGVVCSLDDVFPLPKEIAKNAA